jgi:acid phosphatase
MFTRKVAGAIGIVAVTLMILSGCSSGGSSGAANGSTSPPATEQLGAGTAVAASAPDHVMVVVFENEDAKNIVGAPDAPYLTSLAESGATFTNAHGETHPSQPNYLALFSGSPQGVTDDSCPQTFSGPNLAAQLQAAGRTFVGYSEDLPRAGFTGCDAGDYARRHNPWVNFAGLPSSVNQPYSALPADFTNLPTVSFVVPNLCNDMHDCGTAAGDKWASAHLDPYLRWADTHNSLLLITFDENDGAPGNQILTLVAGDGISPSSHPESINHYSVLRAMEDLYGLPHLGEAETAAPMDNLLK